MPAKKLIEVALPLEAINAASAREKSIRHGHPSTLHLWWARRPLAAARAVIFASLVDDPDDPDAKPDFVAACKALNWGATNEERAALKKHNEKNRERREKGQPAIAFKGHIPTNVSAKGDSPRMRLFDFIERLVQWEATTDESIMRQARQLIQIATNGNPPPLLDPFAGGGSIPLEAQRLGLEAHASDLNPVAVMINKAMIEIPPRFADMPPVNPRDRAGMFTGPHPPAPSPKMREGEKRAVMKDKGGQTVEKWDVNPKLRQAMKEVARSLRKSPTEAENRLWQAIRNKRVQGKKFRRQMPLGAFVVDFYCSSARLVLEVDGGIHASQQEADRLRQELIESLGIRFLRLTNGEVMRDMPGAIAKIEQALQSPHPTGPAPPRSPASRGKFKFNPIKDEGENRVATKSGQDQVQQDQYPKMREGELRLDKLDKSDISPSPLVGEGFGVGGESTWKGAAGLAADVRYYGEWMRERAYERIGHLYPQHRNETVIAWLWARTVISPNPAVNAPVPLASSFILSKKKGRECWARPVIEDNSVRFEVTKGLPPKDADGTMVRRKGAKCIFSGVPFSFDYIKKESRAGRMGAQLMAVVTEGKRGRNYHSPTDEQGQIAKSANPDWKPNGSLEARYTRALLVPAYGLTEWSDLFTPRQLTALTTFSDLVAEARAQVERDALAAFPHPQTPTCHLYGRHPIKREGASDDESADVSSPSLSLGLPLRGGGRGARAYGEALSVYLSFAVDRAADYWSTICSWHVLGEKIGHTFDRQAIPMVWNSAEANPFSKGTGNWSGAIDWVHRSLNKLPATNLGAAIQADVKELRKNQLFTPPPPPRKINSSSNQFSKPPSRVILSTDPPYYDNIGYADLSDFFYVWMRRNLRAVYPELFSTLLVPKADELIASRYRHGGKDEAKDFFENGMLETFSSLRQFVTDDYPQTVYYAFKQQDAGFISSPSLPRGGRGRGMGGNQVASSGWETMLTSLIQAGFSIVGTWPMRTELSAGLKSKINALASSIILVCRPRPAAAPGTSRRRFLDSLRAELPAAINEMKTGSIAPVDMAQASIGPGMAIYSRYSRVLEADGKPMSVRAALAAINVALDEALQEHEARLDPETRFAVDWFAQYAYEKGDFGGADTLARGKNTAVDSVARAGLVDAAAGQVRLIHWSEYDPGAYDPRQDQRPTVWEGAHHLIERLQNHGETGAAALYLRLPGEIAADARDLAYRLYHICERKGWAQDARDYNALVSSWAEISRLAAAEQKRATQAELAMDSE